MLTIGNTIRNARLAAGMKQADLAKRIGCDQRTISLIERDKQRLPTITLCRIADALGCSWSYDGQRLSMFPRADREAEAVWWAGP